MHFYQKCRTHSKPQVENSPNFRQQIHIFDLEVSVRVCHLCQQRQSDVSHFAQTNRLCVMTV